MANRNTELQVDDLLNNFNAGGSDSKGKKTTNKAKRDDWGDDEETGFSFGIGKETSSTNKAKTTKKKAADKGWGELAQEKKEKEEVQPVVEEPKPEEKKKGIFKKVTGETKAAAASINVEEEYFPGLGEEAKPQPKKKAAPVVAAEPVVAQSNAGGPRKFVNAKKTGAGESFAPLNPELTEKPVPVQQPVVVKTEEVKRNPDGFIQRRTEPLNKEATPAPQDAGADSKFKFGGEGPRKFVGVSNKISFKREEEKSEQDILREAREREIEEKLAKEREEQARLKEEREARKGQKLENGESKEEKVQEGTQEEKKIARFTNAKKDPSKPNALKAPAEQAAPKVEAKTEEVAAPAHEDGKHGAKEVIEMNGTLSNKGWGEGALIKKTAKK